MDPMLVIGPYKIPRLGFSMSMVWTNTMGKGAYRGPWMFETTAREMAIDYAAREIGLDPAEFRRRKNLLAAGDLPHTAPAGQVFTEITPLETLDQALEMLDYEAFRKEQAEARAEGRYLGLGICVYVEPTSMGGPTLHTEGCTVRVESSGKRHGLPRHHVTRPERGDHDGAGRRRHARRRRTTTSPSCRPTRNPRPTVPAPVGVAPQSSRVAPRAGNPRSARQGAAGRGAHDGGFARRPRARREHGLGSGHAVEVDDVARDRARSRTSTPTRCPPSISSGLEATVRFRPNRFPTWSNATHVCVVEIDPDTWLPSREALHRVRGLREDDQPERRRRPDRRRRRAGSRRCAPRRLRLRLRRQPAHEHVHGLSAPHRLGGPDLEIGHIVSESTTNPGGLQGPRRGWRDRLARCGRERGGRRARAPGRAVTKTPLGPEDIFALVQAAKPAS